MSMTNAANLSGTPTYKAENQQTGEFVFPAADVKHFIGGLQLDLTETAIRAHFENFGAVKEVEIMRDSATGRSRGFGFVTMAEPSSKPRIVAEKNHTIGGYPITVRPYAEQSELRRGVTESVVLRRKIFIGGVNPALEREVLVNYFSKYGPLDDAQIIKYPGGKSRGFGFVVFKEESACQQVLQQPNHNVTARDQVEVKACLSRNKGFRKSLYASHSPYAMTPGGPYDGYGYGAANYGGYGQNYAAYNPYVGSSASWHGAEYQTAEGGPYDPYAGYWRGYSDVPASNSQAAAGGLRTSNPLSSGAVGRDQYTQGITIPNPYATTKIQPSRQSISTPVPFAGRSVYNPLRSSAGAPSGPVYGRRAGPY